ncbi:putative bacteriocin precursor [Paenibacillus sp. CAA11]|uniref:CLI_3235 family bacteriocin precursor n=1 Tax=Paenibacillus sp. CAA11 TaxID=1532905 RepID=UPI000D39A295|nr:CLI_3235 family bacteriocin precursor [Paenibacillus sp. CAA11]AWB43449.1 putative bacteriocin precursor [Paenibacillus sp. CAA11]
MKKLNKRVEAVNNTIETYGLMALCGCQSRCSCVCQGNHANTNSTTNALDGAAANATAKRNA